MIYIKSILAGLAAVIGTAICIILAVAIAWWWFINGDRGAIIHHAFVAGSNIILAATVIGMSAVLIFTLGFFWEFRRLARSN